MPKANNNTASKMRSSNAGELAHEQTYVTALYERLDVLRTATAQRLAAVWLGGTTETDQALAERDSLADEYQERGAELETAERNLCFGRLDFDDGDHLYIGRLTLRSAGRDLLLTDWRAKASQPFYRATPVERYGVTRRRHLRTAGRKVVGLDDDVLDLDAVDETHLTGEAALLASLRRARTGRMGDIVATIQADQDRIIRDDLNGILVVEGGPGTGKTVVALHRAAYLLYTYRKQLERRGILVIGPNGTFMRYIDQVLPSLGENDVVLSTIGSLYPGVDARAPETPQAARVKGRARMAGVLTQAVADLEQVPDKTTAIRVDGMTYRLTPSACREARDRAWSKRDPDTGAPLPHNWARGTFVAVMLDELTRQAAGQLGRRSLGPGDERDLRAGLAAEPAIGRALDALWPELTPEQALALLYTEPERLGLNEEDRAAVAWPAGPAEWTVADVPLLDELAELLGDTGAANRAAARKHAAEEAERAEALEYAEHVVDSLREAEAIVVPALEVETFVDWIAGRNAETAPRGSLAEQALADRQWTYGHVIVDEAQELSAMSWRMLIRRCPARSMTIVGDLNQTGAADGADSWAQVLDRVAAGRWRTARLTVNYRTPKPVMELAAGFLPPGAEPPLSVRDSGEAPWYAPDTGDLAGLVWREAELVGDGRVAVITPPGLIAQTAAALGVSPGPDLDAPVTVLAPELAKGLEFDSVVVVDPGGIEQASPRGRADLYVALTRTTRRLGLVITGDAPPGLAAAGHQQSAPGAAAAGDG